MYFLRAQVQGGLLADGKAVGFPPTRVLAHANSVRCLRNVVITQVSLQCIQGIL